MSLVALQNLGLVSNRHILVTHLMCNRQVIEGSDAVNPTFLTPDLLPLPFRIQGSSLGRIGIDHSVIGLLFQVLMDRAVEIDNMLIV